MSLTTVVISNAVLALGLFAAVAHVCRIPYRIERFARAELLRIVPHQPAADEQSVLAA
jgi:hypothetical protein